jgi:hypothetical protein
MKMRVRVKQNIDKWWHVEVWHWYWPFWTRVKGAGSRTFDEAKERADRLKNPTILEVQ